MWQFTSGTTWTLTPTTMMDITFGFSRQDQQVYGPDFQDGNYGLDVLGIPGTNDQGIGDPRYAGYPQFNTGFSALGNRDGWNPIYRDERTYSIAANITKLKGRHDLRGGYFLNFMYLDHWQPETGNPRGNFTFRGNTTSAAGAPASNFYNQYATFMLGLSGDVNKSVQNELMTAREWQNALFFRDRWSATERLTLDLGIRWEYYPIMHRIDGRGLDRLDLTNLEVLVAGRGSNPQNNGMEASLNNFAPRVGAVYRFNDKTVFRTGYGLTYNAQPWARAVRGDNDYPITIASTFSNADQFAYYNTLNQGIPTIVGPDVSSGRVPLDRSAAEYTPEIDNIDRGAVHTWNVAFERRLFYDIAVDVAYVGAKGVGGYAGLDINAPLTLGGGDASRPYFPLGRINPINSWGQRLDTRYNSLQVALNKPFTHGFLFKGAYTFSKAMNETDADGRATLNWNTPSEEYRNWAPAGFDRRHNFTVGFAYQLPWQSAGGYDGVLKTIINDWQLNGVLAAFSWYAVYRDGKRHLVEYSEQHPDGRSCRVVRYEWQDWLYRHVVRYDGVRAADWRAFRDHRAQPVLWSRRLQPRFIGLPHVPDRRREKDRVEAVCRKRPEPCCLRQPAIWHHFRNVRADYRGQGHGLPATPDRPGSAVPVLDARRG